MNITLYLALQVVVDHTCVDETDKRIPQSFLDKARTLRILFGHQSVGGNLLEGLEDLAQANGERYAIERASEPEADWFVEGRGLGEFAVEDNEYPVRKIDHFVRKVRQEGFGKRIDVAMMKLCFVDFGESGEEAKAVFERYRKAMTDLEKEFPKVRFVWWTAPLADGGNGARHAFNESVRNHCRSTKGILFDLADLECHDPKGEKHVADGVPVLYSGFTDDGDHLTETSRRRAARAFWWLLARLAGWDGK